MKKIESRKSTTPSL